MGGYACSRHFFFELLGIYLFEWYSLMLERDYIVR
jgi:hypothetical protein